MTKETLGYSGDEIANGAYSRFYNTNMTPLQEQAARAVLEGGQAPALFPSVDNAPSLLEPGYWPVETGFTRAPDTSIRVFCLTKMPHVTPQMWDWWFGWHGCEARRYKLWHPNAHVSAQWADGLNDERYIGRTSLITEYLGATLVKGAISFVAPSVMGFDEKKISRQGEVVICARVGKQGMPLNAGWLLHQIRPAAGGAEMRSRMWFGGDNVGFGNKPGIMSVVARPVSRALLPNPAELLVHNAQEMAHLAGFLPELYAEFGAGVKGVAA